MSLLLAAALLLQDKAAEETFKRIEEGLQNAKTLRIAWNLDLATTNEKSGSVTKDKLSGILMLREREKLVFTVKSDPIDPERVVFLRWEEGRVSENFHRELVLGVDPVSLKTMIVRNFVLTGSHGALGSVGGTLKIEKTARDSYNYPLPAKSDENSLLSIAVEKVQGGAESDGWKTIDYRVALHGVKDPCQLKLWYDPKSLKPKKRLMKWKDGDQTTTLLETYTECDLNLDFSNEAFWEAFGLSEEEKVFRRIEERLRGAKSIRLKFSSDCNMGWQNGPKKLLVRGELLLKEGNKLHF